MAGRKTPGDIEGLRKKFIESALGGELSHALGSEKQPGQVRFPRFVDPSWRDMRQEGGIAACRASRGLPTLTPEVLLFL